MKRSIFERNQIKTWIFLFLVFLIFMCVIVAFLEVYSGYKYYKFRDTLRENSRAIRLREYQIGTTLTFSGKKCNKKDVICRIDSNGYIYPSAIYAKPEIKIFFVGGSTTECGMVDENKRFPFYTGRLIEKITGKKINSYNSGFSGNNSLHSINIIMNKVLPEKPDYIVLMHNINDVSTLVHTGTYWNTNSYRSPIINYNKNILTYKVCLPKNRLVRKLIPYISLVLLPTTFESDCEDVNIIDEWAETPGPLFSDTLKFIDEFRKNIKTFIVICRVRNVNPVLMTQASNFSFDLKSVPVISRILFKKFNNVIREVSAENDMILIDLDKKFSDNSKYFYDYIHYNDSGSIAVSKYIANILSPEIKKNWSR